MKVLFLSVTAGNGHNSCANAIDKCLKDRGIETYILDISESILRSLLSI